MFGGGETQAQTQTVASGVDIQSSCYGGVVPVIYGRARLTGNLIWYGDFQAIPQQSSAGGKGGDDNHGTTTYDYKASFIFALGEGTLTDVQNVWASKTKTTLANSNLSFADGGLAQAPWGYLTTKFAAQALAYAGTGYVYAMAYDLGQSAQMPNLSYEVTGIGANAVSGLPDADPAAVVFDVLTNARYGVGFPAARIDTGFPVFSGYCRAAGLVVSPVFDTQSDAASLLNGIVQSCNAEFVWSGTTLTIVPYGDHDLSANGASYTAPAAPLYSLTDDDFLDGGGQDPVQCSRTRPSDQMNAIRLEWLNRTNDYNPEIAEAKNQAAIEAYGLRGDQPAQAHHFCDANAATLAATLKLQRQSVRNVYTFTLGWRYCLLDPMDIVEISDSGLGLTQQWVRILSLEEDDNGDIQVTAEEYLGGTGHAPLYAFESGSPFNADYNVAPGNVNTPLIFEPPPLMLAARSRKSPQIMIGASGGAMWGGCDVYLSVDNTTYKKMGRIAAPSRQGVLTNTLANSGSNPDTTHTLSVDLSESGGALHSGVQADADAFRTLCYVDGELIAYETASLTGANHYGLTYLQRGVYGSVVAGHASGTQFCRLDDSVASFDLPVTPISYIGKVLYLKFLSYNIYGGAQQLLSDVSPVTYNPTGAGVFVAPPTGISFTVGAEQQKDGSWISFGVVAWSATTDPFFDQYEVQYRLHSGPGPWISWRGGPDTTSFRISPLAPNTAYDVQVRAVRTGGPFFSAWDQAANISSAGKTTPPPAPTGLSVTGGYRQITIDWTASAENDIAFYEVWESVNIVAPGATGSVATRIGLVNGTHYLRTGLGLSDTRFYWIRAQDTSGNFSAAYLGPGHTTTNGVDPADFTAKIIGAQIDDATIEGNNLAADIIDYSKMASGYGIAASVGALPGAGSPLRYAGSLVLLTTDAKLYRWDSVGGAWTVAVDGGDITANSIVANALTAGIITAPYIAADAVTAEKLFIGDTTNLVLDDMFADSAYWTLRNAGSGGSIVSYQTASVPPAAVNGAFNLGAAKALVVIVGNIPAGSGLNYGAASAMIPVKQNLAYRASCAALVSSSSVNKNAQLFIQWFDATQTFISSSVADGPQTGGSYAPTDVGEDGVTLFSATNGATIVNTATAPVGACFAEIFPCVPGGGSAAPAGSGLAWAFSHLRLERQSVGTLIENGAITTGHITAAGIDGSVVTAGTITGDRLTGNFIQGSLFTASSSTSAGGIELDGRSATITGHQNGPYLHVLDDAGHTRLVAGRLQDAYGLWIYDAAGNPIFEEAALGSNVVSTGNVVAGAVTAPNFASIAAGTSGTSLGAYNLVASVSITLFRTCPVLIWGQVAMGFSGNSNWQLRVTVNGADVAEVSTAVSTSYPTAEITYSETLSGAASGTPYTINLYWASDGASHTAGGTFCVLGAQA